MEIGKSILRVDGADKVSGRAKFTADLAPAGALVARIVHAEIANGWVEGFDLSEAQAVDGVTHIFTCFDAPDIPYPTPGHPWSVDSGHQDVMDRTLLTRRVRIYGDDIAVVVARDNVAAERAVRRVKVQYRELPPILSVDEALASTGEPIHEASPTNLLKRHEVNDRDYAAAVAAAGTVTIKGMYQTQQVQHCHIENPISFAYMEGQRVTVVSSTQIPHIVRRIIGQACGIPWGNVRVIKPYIGGGFGNKQEVLYEPLNAWLALKTGKTILLDISREETFQNTRSRHPIRFNCTAIVNPETGRLLGRECIADSQQGGYASHGHAIVANAVTEFRQIYLDELGHHAVASTIYTNHGATGAMRGYGIPQAAFASECLMDDVALAIGMDPLEIRKLNCMPLGFVDAFTNMTCRSTGLIECMEKGAAFIDWTKKRAEYANQSGEIRRGVGMAVFSYKSNVYPISLETSSARIIMNQDGTVQLHLGATEIGQGGDTVFSQMAATAIGIPTEDVHIVSTQDTDVAPFDTGAYASRQSYVTGKAIKDAGEKLRENIFAFAAYLKDTDSEGMDIQDRYVVKGGQQLVSLAELAMNAFYDLNNSRHLTAEVTHHCTDNAFAFGCCFVEVEVDIPLGKITPIRIVNVHDSGKLINPRLAEAQVHGGMSMGLGYALSEEMKYDDKGRLLNGNLLDYKLPTAMDHPSLTALFVETDEPTGPFGNKALGEPPAIPVAPAVRNAVLHATGVALNRLPLAPQRVLEAFAAAGLVKNREEM